MPLHRKISLMTLLLFSVLLAVVFGLEFTHTRAYLERQMSADVGNTLNSLGLSLIPHLKNGDRVAAEATINAVFDGGYYRQILYRGVEAGAEIQRSQPAGSGVPAWFLALGLFEPVERSNTLTSGWLQLGELTVVGDPGYAYQQLWRLSTQIALWFAVTAGVAVLLLILLLRRLFRPLLGIEASARAIAEQRFSQVLPDPGIRELNSLVRSFNHMAERLQALFDRQAAETDSLRRAALTDPLTGLGNRLFLASELELWLADPGEGCLVFVRLYHLDKVTQRAGYDAQERLLLAVARHLQASQRQLPALIVARAAKAEFALIVPNCDKAQLEPLLLELDRELRRLTATYTETLGRMYAIGAAERPLTSSVGDLLAQADLAVQQARHSNACAYHVQPCGGERPALGRLQWRELVAVAISERQLKFQLQPILAMDGTLIANELFSFIEQEQRRYSAAEFMPAVEQYQQGAAFDRCVLELVDARRASDAEPVVVNLSTSAIGDVAFVDWLERWLEADPLRATRLRFELPEAALVENASSLETLTRTFHRLHIHFGFDRIGRHFEQLRQLIALGPHYLKIDRSLAIAPADDDSGFLDALIRLVHDQEVKVYVLRVENETEREALNAAAVDGYQGFIRPPVPWSE